MPLGTQIGMVFTCLGLYQQLLWLCWLFPHIVHLELTLLISLLTRSDWVYPSPCLTVLTVCFPNSMFSDFSPLENFPKVVDNYWTYVLRDSFSFNNRVHFLIEFSLLVFSLSFKIRISFSSDSFWSNEQIIEFIALALANCSLFSRYVHWSISFSTSWLSTTIVGVLYPVSTIFHASMVFKKNSFYFSNKHIHHWTWVV